MRMRTVAVILASLLAAPAAAQQVVRVSGPEITNPGEVSVAINPANPDNVVITSLADGGPAGPRVTDYAYVSMDGGQHWSVVGAPNPGARVQGDDAITFNADGLAIHSYIAFDGIRVPRPDRAESGIYIGTSSDGGVTWAPPVPVIDHVNTVIPFEDKPWPVADNVDGSPHRGNIYVAWTRFDVYGSHSPTDSSQIWFARSTDGGRTFQPGFRISDQGGDAVDSDSTVEGAVPSVGPEGQVYVVWAGPQGLVFDRSLDGGYTFGKDRVISDMPGGWDIAVPGVDRHNGMPVTGVDLSQGPNRGTLYVNWIDQRNGDPDVFVMASRDGGETWSKPVRVNDDPVGDGAAQMFTWMAVDPVDGSVNVVFLDRRGLKGTQTAVTVARSEDGGRTFVNHHVDQPPFTMHADVFYGDYNGIAAYGGHVVAAYPRFEKDGSLAVAAALFDWGRCTRGSRPVIDDR
ncbi:MAG: sialidase family protein [Gemmatimonadota bacterium]